MFESILNSQLNKYLGEWVEGLNRDDLSLSVWGGDIELNDITIRSDVFQKFKMPLELIFGRIGYLRLQVPWRHLGSKPVIAEVRNVWLVVRPISEKAKWQLVETLETSFEKKEELIREIAKNLFDEMIVSGCSNLFTDLNILFQKTAEEKKKEQGITASLVTKIVDNLQVRLEDLHIRIEHEDTIQTENSFSLGVTLQAIDLFTTDQNWQRVYIDRTKDENRGKAMHKVLKIVNFGVYYKTAERSLISQVQPNERAMILETYSQFMETGRIYKHQDDYLVAPILLEVKLIQNDPDIALQTRQALMQLMVNLDQFCITVHKGQYDNVQMLMDLTTEYMRFLNEASLRQRKRNLEQMNDLLKQSGQEVSKNKARELYQ